MSGTSFLPPESPASQEAGFRLFLCARCGIDVAICAPCDHGNIYCAGGCRGVRRRESRQRSGAKYQRSPCGARKHAARQRSWRTAKLLAQKVTHHGFHSASPDVIVTASVAVIVTHPDTEPDYAALANDATDRQGSQTAGDESGGRRSDQGSAAAPASAPSRAAHDAGGDRALQRTAAARCDFCGLRARGLARFRAMVRRPVAYRKPVGSVRLCAPAAARSPPAPRCR